RTRAVSASLTLARVMTPIAFLISSAESGAAGKAGSSATSIWPRRLQLGSGPCSSRFISAVLASPPGPSGKHTVAAGAGYCLRLWHSARPRGGRSRPVASAQARPQVADTDSNNQDAHHPADEDVREPLLEPGAGVRARQAAGAQRDPRRPVRGNR